MKVSLSSCWICILSSPLHYQKTNAYYLSHSQSHTQSLLHSHLHSYKSQSKSKSKSKSKLKSKDFSLYASQDTIDDWNELPSDFPRRNTVLIALQAVRKASDITIRYQPMENCNIDSTSTSSSSNSNAISKDMSMSMSTSTSTSTSRDIIPTIEKIDASPVTLADYAVQAVVLKHLKDNFDDNHGFIAEESSEELQENPKLTQSILDATYPYIQESLDLMRSIDLGKQLYWNDPTSTTATTTKSKEYPYIWVLDPIDGTKGFLRGKKEGGQYCIALALLEDGIPTIGILGCPNLNDGNGSIFVASRGGGCYELSLKPKVEGYNKKALSVTYNQDESIRKIQNARFCIGVEKSFGDPLGKCIAMAKIIHGDDCCLDEDGDIIQSQRMDSQVKFGVIGRGDAEYYVRLPKEGYREWIWDQAAGNVVLEECGGKMTDQDGNAIDFSLGSQLSEDVKGVLGSNGGIFHDALVHAYQKQEEERRQSN